MSQENKNKKPILKTQRQKNEKAYIYAARMINTYTEPITVDMAVARNNLRFWKPTRSQMQSALHQAVRSGLATKFRDAHYKRMVYAKIDTKKTVRPVIDFKGEDITPVAEALVIVPRTPILKPTGEPSLILDAIAVYHGYATAGHVEELIVNHLRHARVNNKKLFNALKELFE